MKRAYVDARYSASYAITAEDVNAVGDAVMRLRDIVAALSTQQLAQLKLEADI